MAKVLEDLGYWSDHALGDGMRTYKRENEDGTITLWFNLANEHCPMDERGLAISSIHPFYIRVYNGTVMNCYADIWMLVPADCVVLGIDERVAEGSRYIDGKFLPPPPPPILIDKNTFFDNFTDEEFELWDQKFSSAPARQRITWNNGSAFTSDSASWPVIQALMIHIFGEEQGKIKAPDHPVT